MHKNIVYISLALLLASISTVHGMEQAALERIAQGGLQAGTMNLLFPNAALHEHVQGERLTINQFSQEHYNQQRSFFTQFRESFLSGLLQSGFDLSNLPGFCGKVLAQTTMQHIVAIGLIIPSLLYNRMFKSREMKEAQAKNDLQDLAEENLMLSTMISRLKQMQSITTTADEKKKLQDVEQKYRAMFAVHMQRAEKYMQNYGSASPKMAKVGA